MVLALGLEGEERPFQVEEILDQVELDRKENMQYSQSFLLEGRMRADIGDWVIKGVAGEFYPCKPDIFEAPYEQVKA